MNYEISVALKNIERGNTTVVIFKNPELLPLYVKDASFGMITAKKEFPGESVTVMPTDKFVEKLQREEKRDG